jgi:hypothetical protein
VCGTIDPAGGSDADAVPLAAVPGLSAVASAAAADVAGDGTGLADDDVGPPASAVPGMPGLEAALHPVSDRAPRQTVRTIFLNK